MMSDWKELLQIVLSFASTAAGVWAAFLIFLVVLLHDMSTEKRRRTKEIWSEARILWQEFSKSTGADRTLLSQKHPEWGIDALSVNRAETDVKTFQKLLQTLSKHHVIRSLGKAQLDSPLIQLHHQRKLSANEWQQAIDILAKEMRSVDREIIPPHKSLRLGLLAIAGNILLLITPICLPRSLAALYSIILAALIMNFSAGFTLYFQLKRVFRVIE
ncbi:MAG: hypothetical protein P4M08_00695 [Oligoflexia bacterium]|nr:hypothetical protein [Oligoflexia bacterium]